MSTKRVLLFAILQITLLQSANAFEPCAIELTEFGYVFIDDDCFLNQPQVEIKGGILPPPPVIDKDAPDLLPIDSDVVVGNNNLYVEIKTGNIGAIDSPDFEITVTVEVLGETHVVSNRVSGIRAGDERRDHIGIVYPNGILQPLNAVQLLMEVDTAGSGSSGEIYETNESNNTATDTCWIDGGDCEDF